MQAVFVDKIKSLTKTLLKLTYLLKPPACGDRMIQGWKSVKKSISSTSSLSYYGTAPSEKQPIRVCRGDLSTVNQAHALTATIVNGELSWNTEFR